MKLVYVAGPYSAPNEAGVKRNIVRAEELAQKVWLTGKAAAICPHLNTAHWGGLLPHQGFMDGDLEIVRRCDAVLMVPDWEHSKGAVMERALAFERDIPVFYTIEGVKQWLDTGNVHQAPAGYTGHESDLRIPNGVILQDGWHPELEVVA